MSWVANILADPTMNKETNAYPKCKSNNLTIQSNNAGYTITDIHSEYEIFRCNACGFEFSSDSSNAV